MDRKPVIFLSSTYIDLKKARSMVIGHLIKNQFLFSGMEGFFMLPMMEQWENIKRTIDDCDIYVTILGDRFGSLAHEGKSCTELEYEYAAQIGKPIIALIQENDNFQSSYEESSTYKEKQELFKENIVCDYKFTWKTYDDLIERMFFAILQVEKNNCLIGYGRPLVRERVFKETPKGFRIKLEYSENTTDWGKKKSIYEEIYYYELDAFKTEILKIVDEKLVNPEIAIYLFLRRKILENFFNKNIVINGFFVNDHDIENALRQMRFE